MISLRSRASGRAIRRGLAVAVALCAVVALSSCSSASSSGSSNGSANGKVTIKVAYLADNEWFSTALAQQIWTKMGDELTKEHPNVRLSIDALPGSWTEALDKLSLLYRNPSTAPNIAVIPGLMAGLYASSGYLMKLNSFLSTTSWWSTFPNLVREDGTVNGSVYAVPQAEYPMGIAYNEKMFREAGIPVPWQPTSWQDIISAAQKIKAKLPGVTPFYANAGAGMSPVFVNESGINNFIVGTSTPTIQAANGKVVVDSPGIRAALGFYKEIYQDGLGPPASEVLGPVGSEEPGSLLPQGKVAIAMIDSGFDAAWTKFLSEPYWPQAPTTIGITAFPKEFGGGEVSTTNGWDMAVSAQDPNSQYALDLVNIAEGNMSNQITVANYSGSVPPDKNYWTASQFLNFASPFNADYTEILPESTPTPNGANYPVWSQGMSDATTALVLHPQTTSVADAVQIEESYITDDLGSSAVETIP
jgi:multiple sugar transport system substrate-binding protein